MTNQILSRRRFLRFLPAIPPALAVVAQQAQQAVQRAAQPVIETVELKGELISKPLMEYGSVLADDVVEVWRFAPAAVTIYADDMAQIEKAIEAVIR